MCTDKLLARATIRGYDEILMRTLFVRGESSINKDGNPYELSKAEKYANGLLQ